MHYFKPQKRGHALQKVTFAFKSTGCSEQFIKSLCEWPHCRQWGCLDGCSGKQLGGKKTEDRVQTSSNPTSLEKVARPRQLPELCLGLGANRFTPPAPG